MLQLRHLRVLYAGREANTSAELKMFRLKRRYLYAQVIGELNAE